MGSPLSLAAKENHIGNAISSGLEHLLLSIITVSSTNANFCYMCIIAAVPSIRIVRRRIPHICQVMSVVNTATGMNNNSVSLIVEPAREAGIHEIGFGSILSATREEVACKVDVVEVPLDGRSRLDNILFCLYIVEAAKRDAKKIRKAGKRDYLLSLGLVAAMIAVEATD
jgi:hypothetical protein